MSGRQLVIAVLMSVASAPSVAGSQAEPLQTTLAPIVRTERSGAGVVRIVYGLNGAAGTVLAVSLEVSNDGGQSFSVRASALTGDVGPSVSPGSEKTIVWDSAKDIEDLQIERLVFRVRVTPTGQIGTPAPSMAAPSRGGPPPTTAGGATTTAKKKGLGKGAVIGIVGGASAAVAAAVAKGGGSTPPSSNSAPPTTTPPSSGPVTRTLSASLSGTMDGVFGSGSCTITNSATGSLVLRPTVAADGTVTGTAVGNVTFLTTSSTCNPAQAGNIGMKGFTTSQLTGTTGRITFNTTETISTSTGPRRDDWSFSGSLTNDTVTGVLRYDTFHSGGSETAIFNVTAR